MNNPVVLTGDSHRFSVADLRATAYDPDAPLVSPEIAGTSLSAFGDTPVTANRRHQPLEPLQRHREGLRALRPGPRAPPLRLRVVETVEAATSPISTLASFTVENGKPGAERA